MKTVIEIFGNIPVVNLMFNESYLATKSFARPGETSETIFGLELEIEDFPQHGDRLECFVYETDGSLRNNGIEAISVPTKGKWIRGMLENFFSHHNITQKKNYSERCSTHVHMNAQDLTIDELKSITLLYQITERLLFNFIGDQREENNFCVPWYQSGLTPSLIHKLANGEAQGAWQKYSALNLKPLQDKGTIEFRHLGGTCDVNKIVLWLNILDSMRTFAKNVDYQKLQAMVMDMNTISNYDMFMTEVFGVYLKDMGEIRHDLLSRGVVNAKLMLIAPKKIKKKLIMPLAMAFDDAPPIVLPPLARVHTVEEMEVHLEITNPQLLNTIRRAFLPDTPEEYENYLHGHVHIPPNLPPIPDFWARQADDFVLEQLNTLEEEQ